MYNSKFDNDAQLEVFFQNLSRENARILNGDFTFKAKSFVEQKLEEEQKQREKEAAIHKKEQESFEQKAQMTQQEATTLLEPINALEQKFKEIKKKKEMAGIVDQWCSIGCSGILYRNLVITPLEYLFDLAKTNVKVAKLLPAVYQKMLPEIIQNLFIAFDRNDLGEKTFEMKNFPDSYKTLIDTHYHSFKFFDNRFNFTASFSEDFNSCFDSHKCRSYQQKLDFYDYKIQEKIELIYQVASLAVEKHCEKSDIIKNFLYSLLLKIRS